MKKISLLVLSFFLSISICQASSEIETYIKTHAVKKPVLLYISEGLCEVEETIIESEEFSKKISNHMTLLKIDCSRYQDDERRAFKERYHVQDLPRLLLFDESGKEISRYGFSGERPEVMSTTLLEVLKKVQDLSLAVKHLEELSLYPASLEELYKSALSLKREEIAYQILNRGVEVNILFFLLEKYRLLCEKGLEQESAFYRLKVVAADRNNEKEALFSLALIDFQTLSAKNASRTAIRPLEEYLELYGAQDTKNRWRLEMMIAQFYLNYDDWATSLKHAELALAEAPLEIKKEIGKCCEYIRNQL